MLLEESIILFSSSSFANFIYCLICPSSEFQHLACPQECSLTPFYTSYSVHSVIGCPHTSHGRFKNTFNGFSTSFSFKTCSEIQDYINEIYHKADQIRQEIEALLGDPDLGNAKLISNQFFAFSRLAERLSEIEWYPLPAITRYNETDYYLGRVCGLLARQVCYPLQTPLVSGFSSNYYGAIPPYRLIKIPAAEHLFLLGLPDLCHEMGHSLYSNYKGDFLGNFFSDLSNYIRSEKERRIREGHRQVIKCYMIS